MERALIVLLAMWIGSPVLACGPGMTAGGGGRRQHQQHRQREHQGTDWMGRGDRILQSIDAENRQHQERVRQRTEQERAVRFINEDNRGELLLESIDGGHGTFSKHSPAETQRRMEARAGHLLRKYKQGRLTNNEALELQMLIHALSQ